MDERDIFLAALEIDDAAARIAYLEKACGGDLHLRARLDALLASHATAGEFLAVPAVRQIATPDAQEDPTIQLGNSSADSRSAADSQSHAGGAGAAETPTTDTAVEIPLTFLQPPTRERSLGRLGHYEILECLGQGAFGIVFRAFDDSLQRVVAVKVLSPLMAATSPPRKRFLREARTAARVRHENVVQIYAVEEQPTPYLVMEYIPGETLQDRLDRIGPLEVPEVLRLGCQMARGLAAAHDQGLIHRDIKPANILLERGLEERVKISDFGLARAADDAQLTQSGIIAGTPMFMAPEQARGESVDRRADLFSLGSVLYTMVSGRPPFRASNTVAVLKRVCDDTPRPIPQLIPETPQWLCDVIARLQAKDPADRFQSAGEVADILAKRLAQLERHLSAPSHDAPAAQPATGAPQAGRPERGHRWAAAAVVLLCALAGLGISEATGVTQFAATVVRIFTPDGTLVVETDDPGVRVTVEGDGGLVIKGAGLEEIRLDPGSYRVHADRDGKPVPLERELVSISRGDREIVKVKLEGPPAPAPATSATGAATSTLDVVASEAMPFVLLDGESRAEWAFATLAEAVEFACDGDTIEVCGNGPFVIEPLAINTAIAIRAGAGFRPSFRLNPEAPTHVISTYASLVLEGLDFQFAPLADGAGGQRSPGVVNTAGDSLYVAGCRFQSWPGANHACLETTSTECVIRDSLFVSAGHVALQVGFPACKSCSVENCVVLGEIFVRPCLAAPSSEEVRLTLTNNTLLGQSASSVAVYLSQGADPEQWNLPGTKPITVLARNNLFGATTLLNVDQSPELWKNLSRAVAWQDRGNLYASSSDYVCFSGAEPSALQTLPQWQQFWNDPDADCQEGSIRLRGGALVARLANTPDQITLDDFRLRADSAGYHADEDGTDLGANVDLIGPGTAYEHWKDTADYEQWCKECGQSRSMAMPELQAFAVMGGAGAPESHWNTLSEAILASADGDTIEIRGNGPFATEPVVVRHGLTIRAGQGFRPVIRLKRRLPADRSYMIHNQSHLTLEGLDFQSRAPSEAAGALLFGGPTLNAANCRFFLRGLNPVIATGADAERCTLRNCEFVAWETLKGGMAPGGEWVVENCVQSAGAIGTFWCAQGAPGTSVRISHVSVIGSPGTGAIGFLPDPLKVGDVQVRFHIADSILCPEVLLGTTRLGFAGENDEPLTPARFAEIVQKLMTFEGLRNVYSPFDPESAECNYLYSWGDGGMWRHDLMSLAAWKSFANSPEEGCLEAHVKFATADLASKVMQDVEKVTPADFRLADDSPGYRAAADGKDLGADVDLVGPGPAYERWKQTPEYQQWLKETGQQAPTAELNAFVVLAGDGTEVGRFNALAEAVTRASDGDTIEIRGNGPFVTEPLNFDRRSLVIRAGTGFRPVLKLNEQGEKERATMIATQAALVLEGLEFLLMIANPPAPDYYSAGTFITTGQAPLHIANCRFSAKGDYSDCILSNASLTVVHNCEFVYPAQVPIHIFPRSGTRCVIDNCVHAGVYVLVIHDSGHSDDAELRMMHNTFISPECPLFHWAHIAGPTNPLRVDASGNIFDTGRILHIIPSYGDDKLLEPAEAEAATRRALAWQEREDLHASQTLNPYAAAEFILWHDQGPLHGPKSLEAWREFWGNPDADARDGQVRYQAGDFIPRFSEPLEKITPEDFRLRADSAGYQAGNDGKDLGADVDLVGPGEAYERWKKTPDYWQWLRETGQLKAELPDAEPNAFVLLEGDGAAERKFDTLAEAVQSAESGDTIEIRGNGPFISSPVRLEKRALTIRAGEGFRPSIWLTPDGTTVTGLPEDAALLETDGDLTLEGLELRDADWRRRPGQEGHYIVHARGPALRLLGCRLQILGWGSCLASYSRILEARNCEFLCQPAASAVHWEFSSGEKCLFDNCLIMASWPVIYLGGKELKPSSVLLTRNTVLGGGPGITCHLYQPKALDSGNAFRLETADNMFAALPSVLWLEQTSNPKPAREAEAEALLPRVVAWSEKRNVYAPGTTSVKWTVDWQPEKPHGPKTLPEWDRFWKQTDTGSLEGRISFAGGDLLSRLASEPLKLTPADFRLTPDSAGYQAGNDGKDLGADVDLVGPGDAYERWKLTPEYQQWLNDTGHDSAQRAHTTTDD